MPTQLPLILALAFPALTIVAAIRDVTTFTIPNWISLALIGAFAPAAFAAGLSLPTVGLHLGIGLAALAVGMALFAFRVMGGGDGKLLAAAALWVGWPALLTFLAATLLAGGVLAVLLLTLRQPMLRPFVLSGPSWFLRLAEPKEPVPYGVAIAVGALYAFPLTPFVAG